MAPYLLVVFRRTQLGNRGYRYENSLGRNVQHVIEGLGHPQVITNFQIHRHSAPDQMLQGELSLETNSFWRYQNMAFVLKA